MGSFILYWFINVRRILFNWCFVGSFFVFFVVWGCFCLVFFGIFVLFSGSGVGGCLGGGVFLV